MVAHTCEPSTWEVKEGGSGAQSHFQLPTKFEASRTLILSQPGLHEALSNKKGKKNPQIYSIDFYYVLIEKAFFYRKEEESLIICFQLT